LHSGCVLHQIAFVTLRKLDATSRIDGRDYALFISRELRPAQIGKSQKFGHPLHHEHTHCFTGSPEWVHCRASRDFFRHPLDERELGMRGFVVGSLLALAMVSGALAEDARNVNIVNETGYGIKFLGFNNPGDDDWSDNELGSVLRNGGSVYVKFNTADDGCVWNLKIEWADPGYPGVLWRDVDLCKISTLKLRYSRATDTTSYSAE
jgi:hypothetical protein